MNALFKKVKNTDDLLCIDGVIYIYFCSSKLANNPVDVISQHILSVRHDTKIPALILFLHKGRINNPHSLISKKEKNILMSFFNGMTTREMSLAYGISDKTISHIKINAINKLGFRTANEFIVVANHIQNSMRNK